MLGFLASMSNLYNGRVLMNIKCKGQSNRSVWSICNLLITYITFCVQNVNQKRIKRNGFTFITKTHLFKYTENFTTKKNFQIKNSDIFHISTQNIDCGYLLEPPRRGGSHENHNLFLLAK